METSSDCKVTVQGVHISSILSPVYVFDGLTITYPEVVTRALCILYEEVNQAFTPLVHTNREWKTDYHYCYRGKKPFNWITQIDMCGLTDKEVVMLAAMDIEPVVAFLRNRIFEVENSWACYGMLKSVLERDGNPSFYGTQTDLLLESVRRQFGKPVALLAVTHEKYQSMMAVEFGKGPKDTLSDAEVRSISGFDAFFGPDEFRNHLKSNNGECCYLLYVRSSDPIEKLRDPRYQCDQSLLSDPNIRQVIKEHTLTLNIDNPSWDEHSPQRINDTKRYLEALNMGFEISDEAELSIAITMAKYLYQSQGHAPVMRAKPLQGTFGCYGHLTGSLTQGNFCKKLRQELRKRGPYILQTEHRASQVIIDEVSYDYIDRVFVGMIDGVPTWLGGHREHLPTESEEAKAGRLHGNKDSVTAQSL